MQHVIARSRSVMMLAPALLCLLSAGCGSGPIGPGITAASAAGSSSASNQNTQSAANPRSVTLSWQPPLTNSDGTTLTDLAGYHIHYGTRITAMNQVVTVPTPGLTNYVIDNLPAGTYYFSITSYTYTGSESTASAVISETLG